MLPMTIILICDVLQGILCFWFVSKMLGPFSVDYRKWIICIGCFLAAGLAALYLKNPITRINYWLYIGIFSLSLFFYRGSVFQKLLWILVFIAASNSIYGVSYYFFSLLLGPHFDALLSDGILCFAFLGFICFSQWLFCYLITQLFPVRTGRFQPSYLFLIILLILATMISALLELKDNPSFSSLSMLVGFILSLFMNLLVLAAYRLYTIFTQKEQEYRYQKALLKNASIQFQELEDLYDSFLELRHDMYSFTADIQQMTGDDKPTLKPEYLNRLEKQSIPSFMTGNHLLDSILSIKVKKIQKSGFIFIGENLHFTGRYNISDPALGSLISNMLDNAYEALLARADLAGEKYIHLSFAYSPLGFVIICENPLLGLQPRKNQDSIISNKPAPFHGLGLTIMRRITEESGGRLEIFTKDDLFRVMAIIPLEK